MGLKNVPRGTKCSCGDKARPGQRTCKTCHAAAMKGYRLRQARNTVDVTAEIEAFRNFREGLVPSLRIYNISIDRPTVKLKLVMP